MENGKLDIQSFQRRTIKKIVPYIYDLIFLYFVPILIIRIHARSITNLACHDPILVPKNVHPHLRWWHIKKKFSLKLVEDEDRIMHVL